MANKLKRPQICLVASTLFHNNSAHKHFDFTCHVYRVCNLSYTYVLIQVYFPAFLDHLSLQLSVLD